MCFSRKNNIFLSCCAVILGTHAILGTNTLGRGQEPVAGPAVPMDAVPPVVLGGPMNAAPPRTSRLPLLSDLTLVKLVELEGELKLVMMLDSFRAEKRTVPAMQLRDEERIRNVADGRGGFVEQTFTIQVLSTQETEIDVKIPAGRKPVTKPADLFRFYDLQGQELEINAAVERLSTLRAAFMLERFAGELPELPDLYTSVLAEDCLVVVTEETVRDPASGQQPIMEILPARGGPPLEPVLLPVR